jgi:hypothetical protein
MLLLIDNRMPHEPAPEPPVYPRRRRLARPGQPAIRVIVAITLVIGGLMTGGLVSAVLLFFAVLAAFSAVTTAMPYGFGLAEHRQ